jgi:hypothetical protein
LKIASAKALLTALLFAGAASCHAQQGAAPAQAEENEPKAIIEIGAAGEWALTHGLPSYGPNFAVEFTPIKEKLEIEGGVTPFFSRGQTEWDTDLLFKKPYTLSRTAEFMCGVGPEWAHTIHSGKSANSIAGAHSTSCSGRGPGDALAGTSSPAIVTALPAATSNPPALQ